MTIHEFVNLTRAESVARMEEIQASMERLGAKHRMSVAESTEFDDLRAEFDSLNRHVQRLDATAGIVPGVRSGRYRIDTGSTAEARPDGNGRDAALRTLDRHVNTGAMHPDGAQAVEALVGTGGSWVARWAVATGDDAYTRAFAKLFTGGQHGHLRWTPEEADAYRRVEALRDEQRALGIGTSGIGNGGDAMVPLTLDPAILLSSAGSTSSLLQISRVEAIATNSWNGVSSAGVTAEWLDEFEESADGTPTLTQPSIPVHRGSAFVPFGFEVEQDAVGFIAELQRLLLDASVQLSDAAYTTGSGTGEPKGFVTALAANVGSVVAPTTAETLAAADAYKVQNALPPRFQAGARWAANLAVLNTLRQFETTNGALKFPALQDNPPTLLGRPVHEQSNMDGTYNPAATANNYLLAYADFSQFCVVTRIGATLEIVGHLLGSSRRPNGTRGALLWWRTGSDFLVPEAGRLLSIPTTA